MEKYLWSLTSIFILLSFIGDNTRSDWQKRLSWIKKNPAKLEYKHGYTSPVQKKRKEMLHLTPDSLTYGWEKPITREL